MSILLRNLQLRGSAVMPDDDTPTNVGAAIAPEKKVTFTDVSGTLQAVSSAAGDTTQTVTVYGRNSVGALISQAYALNGVTPVTDAEIFERILKAVKGAVCAGDVAIEAQSAERSNTATAGSADTITLDGAASAVDDYYNGMVLRTTGGTGPNQLGEVIDYVGATKVATMSKAFAVTPDGTTTFRLAKGVVFEDDASYEVMEVRRAFYNASAEASGGSTRNYYEKIFFVNRDALSLTSAEVAEDADPSALIAFGLAATVDDTGDNGAFNRQTAPGVVVFASTLVAVPGGALAVDEAIGVWLRLTLAAGAVATKSTYSPRLQGLST